jgi:DtxR family Mn-dependent transcriptional regulator
VISDEVEERLVEVLGHPTTCPHGNPIPGSAGVERSLVALADALPGQRVRLERVTEQVELDMPSLKYLNEHGFVPGVEGTLRSKAPDGTLTIDLDGSSSIAVGPALAQQLFVGADGLELSRP